MMPTIMVVEDEPSILELLRINLVDAGYDVREAADAESAQRMLKESLPDLMLLDWMLPGLSGLAFAKQLRGDARTRELPVIMVTALDATIPYSQPLEAFVMPNEEKVVAAVHRAGGGIFAGYRAAHPGANPGDLLAALQGDWWCRVPALRLADARAGYAKSAAATYMYEFAWPSPQFNGRLGACHALEIAFVFDTLGYSTEALLGPNPPQHLADTMHAAWVAFATRGDPGWPQYDLSRRATMHFDTTSEVVDDPLSAERVLWEGLR
jgi:CheY-like chemotaxis protein